MQDSKRAFRVAQITSKSASDLPHSNTSFTNAALMCPQLADLVANYRSLPEEQQIVMMPAGILPVPSLHGQESRRLVYLQIS